MRVEARNRGRVRGRLVLGRELVVLRAERVELPRQAPEGRLGLLDLQLAGFLQGGEGLFDARDGRLVGRCVEVVDGVLDELAETGVSTWSGRGAGRAVFSSSRFSVGRPTTDGSSSNNMSFSFF